MLKSIYLLSNYLVTANPMILAIIKTFALINTPLSQSQATR